MEIFEPLVKDVTDYLDFTRRLAEEDEHTLSMLSEDRKYGFMAYAVYEMANPKMATKLIYGCLINKTWGLLVHILTESSSQKGVITWTLKNYDQLPEELQPGIVALVCYGNKWMDKKLNSLFFKLIKKLVNSADEQNTDEETVDIYYPLGWDESVIDALHNPCWYASETDAAAICFYSKLYFDRSLNIEKEEMFGSGERKDIDCIKTNILRATVKKCDIVATMTPEILNIGFLPVKGVIFDSVSEIELINTEDTSMKELICLQTYLDENSIEVTDESIELYDKLIDCCEKAGLPSFTDPKEVSGKVLQKPVEIAKMIRVVDRFKTSDAMSGAKDIIKNNPGVRWTCTYAEGYKTKPDYYYSCICYSPFAREFIVTLAQYIKDCDFGLAISVEDRQRCNDQFIIMAIDYDSESSTIEEYRMKMIKKYNLQ